MTEEQRRKLQELKGLLSKITPYPWRWGDYNTTFGQWEPGNIYDRCTLEYAPTFLQFSAGVRERDEGPSEHILTAEDPIENSNNQYMIASAPQEIEWLISLVEELDRELVKSNRRVDYYKALVDKRASGEDSNG